MGPLAGIRVVELSTGIAGPLAGMLLGDYGADVIKVEPPAGDPARAVPGFEVWNRNKRSVAAGGGAADRARLAALVAGADIVVYGAESQLDGLPWHARQVRLFLPPYLPGITPWAGRQESAGLLTAIGGTSRRQSSFDGGPIDLVYPFALYVQGVWGAGCAVAALIDRERTGFGRTVTVGGLHAIVATSPASFAINPAHAPLTTDVGPGGRNPTYTTYRCQDGRWIFLGALIPKFQANAFKVLGVGDLFADPRIAGQPNRLLAPENRAWLRETIGAAFASRPLDAWVAALEAGDCPAGQLLDRDDWLDHPQIVANDLRVELDSPIGGRVTMPGLCADLSKTPGSVRAPAPRLGDGVGPGCWLDHTLAAERSPDPRPAARRAASALPGAGPLAGIRVLNLGTILAGPYAGSLLASLGADVVKVEPPAGDAFRDTGFMYNRGMRGLAIDLRAGGGRAAFQTLVRGADAVLDNGRLGVAPRLGVDYATLASVKPDIVTVSIAGFGERGPLAAKPAFDPVIQAMSGMMTAQGGDSDPAFFTIPVNDIAAAVISVLGVCLALYHRARTGEGQRVVTSLVASSLLMQSGELVRSGGQAPARRGGRDHAGSAAWDRFYQMADGWLRVQAPDLATLAAALGDDVAPGGDDVAPGGDDVDGGARRIAQRLAAMPCDTALWVLDRAGIPTAPARQPIEVARDLDVRDAELFAERPFPDGGAYLVPCRYADLGADADAGLTDAPGIGEHSREILAEAGLPAEQIEALIRDGSVAVRGPFVLRELVNYR